MKELKKTQMDQKTFYTQGSEDSILFKGQKIQYCLNVYII